MGGERRENSVGTPPTLPRGLVWWHERRGLLASGLHSPSRLPSGVLSGAPGLKGQAPVTVAGPRRYCTGFRVAPFVLVQLYRRASLRIPPARRKGGFEFRFQPSALCLVDLPLLVRRFLLPSQVAGVEDRDGGDQRIRGTPTPLP